MRRSEWLVRVALAFCLVYGVVAIRDRPREKFPFFAWDLFSRVPDPHGSDFSIRLTAAHGLSVAAPVYYEDSQLQSGGSEIQAYSAIQQIGLSIERGSKLRAALQEKQFEISFFGSLSDVHYEVVKRTYDIRKRISCRECFTNETVLARLTIP